MLYFFVLFIFLSLFSEMVMFILVNLEHTVAGEGKGHNHMASGERKD